jgi:NAD(P)-dependent dehydrogenase (short-subunit alcohol dehydrogenase family)
MSARTWLITGISSGFGRELTQQLLERGDRVVGSQALRSTIDVLQQRIATFEAQADIAASTDFPAGE